MKRTYLSVLEKYGYKVNHTDTLLKVKFPNYYEGTYSEKEYCYLSRSRMKPNDYVLIQVGPNKEHLKFAKVISSYPVSFKLTQSKAWILEEELEERDYPMQWVSINLKDKSSNLLSYHFSNEEKTRKERNGELS